MVLNGDTHAGTTGVRAGCHASHHASFAVMARPSGKPAGSGCPSLTQHQRQACSSRSGCAALSRRGLRFMHPGKLTPGRKGHRRFACRAPSLRRNPAHVHPGAVHPFTSLSPGLRQPQPGWLSRDTAVLPQNFLPEGRQKLSRPPRTSAPGRGRLRPAAKVLKRVKVIPPGTPQQASAKRQHRGSRNSTGDG